MADIIIIFKPQLRDLLGRFAKAKGVFVATKAKEMKELADVAKGLAQEEAPKKDGRFAQGIDTRLFLQGETLGFRMFSPQPLGGWIRGGTKPHPIPKVPKTTGALAFFWGAGPQGAGTYFFKQVQHPGTKPDDYALRAKNRLLPLARVAMRKMALSYTIELTK